MQWEAGSRRLRKGAQSGQSPQRREVGGQIVRVAALVSCPPPWRCADGSGAAAVLHAALPGCSRSA